MNFLRKYSNNRSLCEAIKAKNWRSVKHILTKKVDLNFEDSKHNTPLAIALWWVDTPLNIVSMLLTDSNINMCDWEEIPPLQRALQHKRWDLARLFITNNADIHKTDTYNNTALSIACGCYDAPRNIICQLISRTCVNHRNNRGSTPLHIALSGYKTNISTVQVLLGHGSDYKIVNNHGQTPMLRYIDAFHTSMNASILHKIMSHDPMQVCKAIIMLIIRNTPQEEEVESLHCLMCRLSPIYLTSVAFKYCPPDPHGDADNIEHIGLVLNGNIQILIGIGKYYIVDMICHMLNHACYINSQTVPMLKQQFPSYSSDKKLAFARYVDQKQEEFNSVNCQPSFLLKLCVLNIRQCMPSKQAIDFDRLHLPPRLISLVKLESLASELTEMWVQGIKLKVDVKVVEEPC
jgi:ankyrin repeat protein